MVWEQSRRTRTIATSRSDDNRNESKKKCQQPLHAIEMTNDQKRNRRLRHALPLRTNPEPTQKKIIFNLTALSGKVRPTAGSCSPLEDDAFKDANSISAYRQQIADVIL